MSKRKKQRYMAWAVILDGRLMVLSTNRAEARVARRTCGGSVRRVKLEVVDGNAI